MYFFFKLFNKKMSGKKIIRYEQNIFVYMNTVLDQKKAEKSDSIPLQDVFVFWIRKHFVTKYLFQNVFISSVVSKNYLRTF